MIRLLGVGNPLLDIVAQLNDLNLFEKYKIAPGSACLADESIHKDLFNELRSKCPNFKHIAGGSTHNTIRMFQALSRPEATCLMGCLGKDEDGKVFESLVKTEGSICAYCYSPNKTTGKCAVMVHEKERALCADLGASVDLSFDHVVAEWSKIKDSFSAVYSAAFVLSSCAKAALFLSQECAQNGKIFAFNISADFLMHQFHKEYLQILSQCNIVFGNNLEFQAFANLQGLDAKALSVGEIGCHVLEIMTKSENSNINNNNNSAIRHVVITQGAGPVIVASFNKPDTSNQACETRAVTLKNTSSNTYYVSEYKLPEMPKEKIVDLNGAGDAFVGGFLFAFLNGNSMEKCVLLGAKCAQNVIQHSGFDFDLPSVVQYVQSTITLKE